MKLATTLLGLFALLGFDGQTTRGADANASLVIEHVTVIDGTGAPARADQTVVVAGDRIVEVAAQAEAPRPHGVKTIDARGKFLIPGLWDMHVHVLWGPVAQFLPLFIANGVTGIRDLHTALTPAEMAEWRAKIAAGEQVGPRLVCSGPILDGPPAVWENSITVSNADEGREAVRKLKGDGRDMVKVYERLPRDAYFAILDEAQKLGLLVTGHTPQMFTALEVAQAGQACIEHLSRVLDFCQESEGESLTPLEDPDPQFTAHVRAALSACFTNDYSFEDFTPGANEFLRSPDGLLWRCRHKDRGEISQLVFYQVESRGDERRYLYRADFKDGHVFFRLERTIREKIRFVEDNTVMSEARTVALLDTFQRQRTWQCPTFAVRVGAYRTTDEMREDVRVKYLNADVRRRARWGEALIEYPLEGRERFRTLLGLAGRMHRQGIALLAGTDAMMPYSFPGFSLHDELAFMVQAGLSPADALQTATLNPARFLKREPSLGTIESDKLADLVLLDANPLEDIRNTRRISAVIANGRLFDRAALDAILAEMERLVAESNAARVK